jgi:hypothetical protein
LPNAKGRQNAEEKKREMQTELERHVGLIPAFEEGLVRMPSLVSENEDLSRIYYNSILTVISLERVNLPLVAPRVYLTSSGNALPYNCSSCLPHINGILEIGGSAMYYWGGVAAPETPCEVPCSYQLSSVRDYLHIGMQCMSTVYEYSV